ncbi:hypothetical protein GGX14DRAFT_572375 [Mycena pura]|uniref:Uncharacterized protein n=1 Tax=Mycena pura TaxID=153505 RepID=A0AAD6YAZ4_9AGAR|nr:hypothetical protein GGX14DRAFT_572375 [Mycena pura]
MSTTVSHSLFALVNTIPHPGLIDVTGFDPSGALALLPDGAYLQALDTISCSILVKQLNEDDVFQIFPSLIIPRSLKIPRGDAFSVRITGLIENLRTHIFFQPLESLILTKMIDGTHPMPDSVSVSTTRVPDFDGDGFKAAGTGYLFLGKLSQVYHAITDNPTQHSFSYTSGDEVLSGHLTAKSRNFFASYAPMGVTAESNFSIIFTVQHNGFAEFLHPTSTNSGLFRSFSTTSFESDAAFFSDSDLPEFYNMPTNHTDVDSITAWENLNRITSSAASDDHMIDTTASPSGHEHKLTVVNTNRAFDSSSNSSIPSKSHSSPYSSRLRSRAGSLTTENSILLLLPTFVPALPSSAFHDAKFTEGRLMVMVRNFGSMQQLLDIFSLQANYKAKRAMPFTDHAGKTHQLSAVGVLNACGWNHKTFQNKQSRYQNAEKVAKMEWKGPVPAIDTDAHISYNCWQGTVYMWSAAGPVATGLAPNSMSGNKQEICAAELTQAGLDKIGSPLFRATYLQNPTLPSLSTT